MKSCCLWLTINDGQKNVIIAHHEGLQGLVQDASLILSHETSRKADATSNIDSLLIPIHPAVLGLVTALQTEVQPAAMQPQT